MEQNYILLILNCDKYKHKAELQKQLWIDKELPSNIQYYYVRGDPTLKTFEFNHANHTLYVNCKDDYISLPQKTIKALDAVEKTFKYKYIFKTDDDQMLVNKTFFQDLMKELQEHKYDYGGFTLNVKDHYSTCRIERVEKKILLKACTYCNGRFYLLSNRAVKHVLLKEKDFEEYVFEDHAIGLSLTDLYKIKIKSLETQLGDFMDIPMYIESKYFIHTECVNCPEICINAIKSFYKTHSELKLNVFLTKDDMTYLQERLSPEINDNITYHIVSDILKNVYKQNGHLATAMLWNYVILNCKSEMKKIIHIDSDVFFRGDIVLDVIKKMEEGYDIVGGCRTYKKFNQDHNLNLADTVSTYCFGYDPSFIDETYIVDDEILIPMIRGFFNPLGHRVMDFFDPITYTMLHNKARMFHISHEVIGYLDKDMNQNSYVRNMFPNFDVAEKIIHFAAVGSGLTYRKNGYESNVPKSYLEAGLKSLKNYESIFNPDCFSDNDSEEIKTIRQWNLNICNNQ